MDVQAYFQRINYHGPQEPTIETLRALHLAHILSIPFENLDIPSGRWITLDEALIFDKIVNRRRGGFCFELNGLFAALLEDLGFNVRRLASRMWSSESGFSEIEFGHLTLLVELEEPWLADVTCMFREPLRINQRSDQTQCYERHRITEQDSQHVLWRQVDGDWQPRYRFGLQPYRLKDFIPACNYTQTSPDSWFTQRRLCSRATLTGRVTLSEEKLTITENGDKKEYSVSDEDDFRNALHEYFDLDVHFTYPFLQY